MWACSLLRRREQCGGGHEAAGSAGVWCVGGRRRPRLLPCQAPCCRRTCSAAGSLSLLQLCCISVAAHTHTLPVVGGPAAPALPKACARAWAGRGAQFTRFTRFTSTRVQILTQKAEGAGRLGGAARLRRHKAFLALLVQKYKY